MLPVLRPFRVALADKCPEREQPEELLIEAPEASAESVGQTVRELMETAMTLDVALEVEVGIGNHWAEQIGRAHV